MFTDSRTVTNLFHINCGSAIRMLSKTIRTQTVCKGNRLTAFALLLICSFPSASVFGEHSVARQWNELMISAIRRDLARPTVHARNLFHVSLAMYDAWTSFDPTADSFLTHEHSAAVDVEAARAEAVSFAAYRVLKSRFATSPGAAISLPSFDARMTALGYDKDFTSTVGNSPAALGNRIAQAVLAFGLADHSNEAGGYANLHYAPINPPLVPLLAGNPNIVDPNRWQPLALNFFVDQGGNVIIGGYPAALTPEWGQVTPFSLSPDDLTIYHRDNFDWFVYHDPGPPPMIGGVGDEYYKWGHEQVALWSGHLDPSDGVLWDISPASRGNSPLPDPADYATYYDQINGGDTGSGYAVNPVTGKPYSPQVVPRGDFARALAEFWADGPTSETPPGHWFSLLNYVSDHPLFEKRFEGVGPIIGDLEWDVKSYLAMGGALHDVAIAVWGAKGWYDSVRPISAIRYMADRGQSTDSNLSSYDPNGIHLYPGNIELITAQSSAPGERHAHLAGHEGEIAIRAWRGPNFIANPATDVAGVGWILAANWWPYQRPTFVSPPFPGYTSGHSAYSRAGAEVMTLLTGSSYFPGGLGEFVCPQNQYLVFEEGPSVTIKLQWASYYDAADQSAMSRIWGGIHPGQDDLPSRQIGSVIGVDAYHFAKRLFSGQAGNCPTGNDNFDADTDGLCDTGDLCPSSTPPGGCVCESGYCCREGCMIGDSNGNGVRDLSDFRDFQNCFTGDGAQASSGLEEHRCSFAFDVDGDTDIDTYDSVLLCTEITGP